MKPEVRLQIAPDIYAVFNTVEEIDELSEVLASCRADLEHQIEMEKQRRKEKRINKRRRSKNNANQNKDIEDLLASYEKLKEQIQSDEVLSGFFSPIIEMYDLAYERIKSKLK